MASAEIDLSEFNDAVEEWREDVTVGETERVIGTNVLYAPPVEYGSAPHVITGDPLAFTSGGDQVFTDRVNHPGTDPQPHVRPGLRAVKPELGRLAVASDSLEEFLDRAALLALGNIQRRTPVDTGHLRNSYEIL